MAFPVTSQADRYPDHHVHRIWWLNKESLLHYKEAALHYKKLLDRAWEKVQARQDLLAILDERERNSLPIGIERDQVDYLINHLDKLISDADQFGDTHFAEVSHGWVRLVKSLCHLYEEHLRREIDRLEKVREMPAVVLSSLRTRLAQLSEKTSMGVFANATPMSLLIEDWITVENPPEVPAPVKEEIAAPGDPGGAGPVLRTFPALPVLDTILRERTVDLYSIFEAGASEERYDTVLREIGAVVEDRLRNVCAAPVGKVGMDLASYAFTGSAPKILLSSNVKEQEGVHHLFRGFFGWVRNPAGHRLLGKVSKERVLQMLGFADYLLGLLGEGQAREGGGTP